MKEINFSNQMGFDSLDLDDRLVANIRQLGWDKPTEIQLSTIPVIMGGSDLYGIAQTGTGKTAAFALPVLHALIDREPAQPLKPYCVVLSPTRELAQQIATQFALLAAGLNIRVMTAYGGTADRPQTMALNEGREIVVGAPGRVLDLMGQGYLQFASLAYCILDEADRMFDMGFIDDIKRILNRMPSRRQTLLFSATMPSAVKRLAKDYLFYPEEIRIGTKAPPRELKHELWLVDQSAKFDALMHLLEGDYDSVLVFCRTRKGTADLARQLAKAGESVVSIHADRTQRERDRALEKFKDREARALVATDVASRGLDIEGIDLVVNFDVPEDPEDYVHRVGRTARAKKSGLAVTLVTMREERAISKIEGFINKSIPRRTGRLAGMPGKEGSSAFKVSDNAGEDLGPVDVDMSMPDYLVRLGSRPQTKPRGRRRSPRRRK